MWRVSSLTLAGTPVIFGFTVAVTDSDTINIPSITNRFLNKLQPFLLYIGVISRLLLVALMLASLRSLPSSAHQIISWTTYIPHL